MATSHSTDLQRGLGFKGLVSLALSDITPMASLLVVASSVLALVGTASVLAFVIGCVIAVAVAMCMAELGSMYPTAGGLFYIVHKVLGRPVGFLAMVDYVLQGIFIPASLALGLGTYLHSLNKSIPVNLSSAIGMLLITLLAILRIHVSAVIVTICLAIEVVVLVVITGVGLSHWNQPFSILTHPTMLTHGSLKTVAASAIIAAIATSMFSVNGYDSAINFSEEVIGKARNIGRAVIIAALTGIVLELIPFVTGLFGTHDLKAYLGSATPFTDSVTSALGATAGKIVIIGALFAIVNATLAITLQFARVLWASGRDKAWPDPVNNLIGKVHPKFRSPWISTLIIGGISTIFCLQASLVSAVTFTAVLIILLYALIAVSALVSRVRDKDLERPYKMILWPLAPIVTIVGVGVALTQQKRSDLGIIVVIVVASLIYYFGYVHRAKHDRWVPHTPTAVD
jgi:amino acid transporter